MGHAGMRGGRVRAKGFGQRAKRTAKIPVGDVARHAREYNHAISQRPFHESPHVGGANESHFAESCRDGLQMTQLTHDVAFVPAADHDQVLMQRVAAPSPRR